MPKVSFDERIESALDGDFSDRRISVSRDENGLENITNSSNEAFLNDLLSLVKLIFLYIPGAIMIHFVGTFIYFYFLFGLDLSELFSGMIIGLVGGMFLTMFGIGKMSDLRYLRVPGVILAGSFLISLVFTAITQMTGVPMTGFFLLSSFPITIILGYLVKRFLDKA